MRPLRQGKSIVYYLFVKLVYSLRCLAHL